MLPDEIEMGKKRLERFILETVWLDALLDARARDIDFINTGGQVFYTPDSSTWHSFFFPVTEGQEYRSRNGDPIPGFAEVYLEADRTDSPYLLGSPLSRRAVTGMLGKVLIDTIFVPQNENGQTPTFFLTEESKAGLNEAIKTLILSRANRTRNIREQQAISGVLSALKTEFSAADDAEQAESLFLRTPNSLVKAGALGAFLDDANLVNLNDRIEAYDEIAFFDWAHIASMVDEGERDETTFNLGRSDAREFERLKVEFTSTFRRGLPKSVEHQIASLSEVLALNCVVNRNQNSRARVIYLTNTPWAIRFFDRFVWDQNAESPLRPGEPEDGCPTVSSLFVRNPLCFLHDIELRPEDGESRSSLKVFMDSVVPRKLHDDKRMDTSPRSRFLISRALDDLETKGQLKSYLMELDKFYERWTEKKVPWVNAFLARRAQHWVKGLQLFSEEGFYSFWRKVNRDFTRLSWQFGIYLAIMTERLPARAAPLIFIDCDATTNAMLSALQRELAGGDIEGFRERIDEFHGRSSNGREERKEYFDALVNAVLFMFSSQFETSKLHAETACELAMKSTDRDVTGREAYYLRSYLVRVTAANRMDLESARKLMLIARSKLELDNSLLGAGSKISTIRFDLEDWSRRIVTALADRFELDEPGGFPAHHMREYLTFVRNCTDEKFKDLSAAESSALRRQICERMKFNFLVLSVTMDDFSSRQDGVARGFLGGVVNEWNRVFGSVYHDLQICVDAQTLRRASIIEQAYLVALLVGAPESKFIHADIDVGAVVSEIFGEANRDSIRSAETSFLDRKRYERLRRYVNKSLSGAESMR